MAGWGLTLWRLPRSTPYFDRAEEGHVGNLEPWLQSPSVESIEDGIGLPRLPTLPCSCCSPEVEAIVFDK